MEDRGASCGLGDVFHQYAEVDLHGDFRAFAACEGEIAFDHALHFGDIADHVGHVLAQCGGLDCAFAWDHGEGEAHSGEGGSQVMRHAGQHGGALGHEARDAVLHAVEGDGGLAHFLCAFGADGAGVAPEAELFGGAGEAADGADLVAHEERGDDEEQHGAAECPDDEEPELPDIESFAGGVDIEHAVRG